MTHFTKNILRMIAATCIVSVSALSAPAFAQGYGNPFPPNLTFPEPVAFEGKTFWCMLTHCQSAATSTVTKARTPRVPKAGE